MRGHGRGGITKEAELAYGGLGYSAVCTGALLMNANTNSEIGDRRAARCIHKSPRLPACLNASLYLTSILTSALPPRHLSFEIDIDHASKLVSKQEDALDALQCQAARGHLRPTNWMRAQSHDTVRRVWC